MNTQFKLLVLGSSTESGGAPNAGLAAVQELCSRHNLEVLEDVAAVHAAAACNVNTFVLIAGEPSSSQLTEACEQLLASGSLFAGVMIVVDALANAGELSLTLAHLSEHEVEMTCSGALSAMLTTQHLMVYRFGKADNTATVAAMTRASGLWARCKIRLCRSIRQKQQHERNWLDRLLLSWLDDARALVIVRGFEPFKGFYAFPGGFLNCFLESLPQCGAREGGEECRVKIDPRQLVLVDVRSAPARDPRGHVVDHGYAWFIPRAMEAQVLGSVEAGDDADSLRFISVSELLTTPMAFDHKDLLLAALKL